MHLRATLKRLEGKYQIGVESTRGDPIAKRSPAAPRSAAATASGGHGQFGDVVPEIRPSRGAGFEFTDTITGGVVPKQYIFGRQACASS